jgi:hypothetical protein
MINIITKEKFSEEFEDLIENGVDAIDAILTILNRHQLNEEQAPRFMTERILGLLRIHAAKLKYIKVEEELTLDDFC